MVSIFSEVMLPVGKPLEGELPALVADSNSDNDSDSEEAFSREKIHPRLRLLTPGFVGNARMRIQFRDLKFASSLHRNRSRSYHTRQESINKMIT